MQRTQIDVTFPSSGRVRSFRSVRSVSRMLSGNGRPSSSLRRQINLQALNNLLGYGSLPVKGHLVYG